MISITSFCQMPVVGRFWLSTIQCITVVFVSWGKTMFNMCINHLWKMNIVAESFRLTDHVCDETFISLNSFTVHGGLCAENKVALVTAIHIHLTLNLSMIAVFFCSAEAYVHMLFLTHIFVFLECPRYFQTPMCCPGSSA